MVEINEPDYRVSTDLNDFDLETIHQFISNSYWAKGIPLSTFKKAVDNSLCFSILEGESTQVGFARMVTDKATFAYLADVFVLPEHRRRGVSQLLMESIMAHPDLQGLRRMLLATKDAHGLYQKFGFTQLASPEILMELWKPNIYQKN